MTLRNALVEAGVPQWPAALEKAERQIKQLGRHRAIALYRWLLETDLALKGTHSAPHRGSLRTGKADRAALPSGQPPRSFPSRDYSPQRAQALITDWPTSAGAQHQMAFPPVTPTLKSSRCVALLDVVEKTAIGQNATTTSRSASAVTDGVRSRTLLGIGDGFADW